MAIDILVVDDEADIRELVCDVLQESGYVTRTAGNSKEALEAVHQRLPHAVILDIWLQGSELDGLGILENIKQQHPELPVIMISGHGTIETAISAIRLGAYDYIEKPFKEDRLKLMVKRAIETTRLKVENRELRQKAFLGGIELIGNSSGINQLRNTIEKAAPTKSRIMLTGAAGSGKETVARLIHSKSKRAQSPFVVLNAASISPEHIDSELCGLEEPKSMVGGLKKVGCFELAHGGTLFIDEVTDLPLAAQSKLLRILQEQSFERVNGNKRVEVDVRVIAATTKNIQHEIQAGRLREDLYYRLNVVPVHVPSLVERREDIPLLAEYLLERAAKILGLPSRKLSSDAIATLQAYNWPGNLRQLRNVAEWLLIMTTEDPSTLITAAMLPPEVCGTAAPLLTGSLDADIMAKPLREAREIFERQYLEAQLNRFNGNISRTAIFIGMERSALHRKLKMLKINDDELLEA